MPLRIARINRRVLTHPLRALRHRNYRLFFIGQGVSLMGTWLQGIALPWLTYRLTDSALMLGLVAFLGQAPILVIGPLAGVISDRVDRRRLLLVTQTLAMLQALLLAAITLAGLVEVWHIIILSVTLGCIAAFDIPTRQAFMTQMIGSREDLGNAIALNSSLVNLARMIGPALGGVLIGLAGEGVCFLVNGLSYIGALAALMMMRFNAAVVERRKESLFASLHDGFAFTFGFPPIRAMILLLAVTSATGMCFTVLMPVFARGVFGGDEGTYSFLMAFSGLGALIGAGYLAVRPGVVGLGKFILLGAAVLGVSILGFAMTGSVLVAGLLRMTGSAAFIVQMAASNTILQTVVDDERRGRVMAFFSMAFIGTAPIGALLAGVLAERIGPRPTLLIAGSVTLAVAAVFAFHFRRLRAMMIPIYERLGLLPPPI